mgnify:CR=1 FL=1
MMSVHSKVGTNQSSQVVNTLLACDSSRSKLLVQQSTAGLTVVHLGAGFNNCGRSVDISTLLRRDTLRQRIMSRRPFGVAIITSPKYTWQVVGSIST